MKIKSVVVLLFLFSVLVMNNCTSLNYDARKDKELMHVQDSLSHKIDSLIASLSNNYDDIYGGDQNAVIDSSQYKKMMYNKQKELQSMHDSLAVIMDNIIKNHLENDSTSQETLAKYKAKINKLKNDLANIKPDTVKIATPIQYAASKIDSLTTSGGSGTWIGIAVGVILLVVTLISLYFKNRSADTKKV